MLRNEPRFVCCEVSTVPLRQAPHLFSNAIHLLLGTEHTWAALYYDDYQPV